MTHRLLRIELVLSALICGFCGLWLGVLSPLLPAAHAQTTQNGYGVVLIYHRFGESDFASTNISLAQFDAHIKELQTPNKYNLPKLSALLDALNKGEGSDKRTVVITVDDAYDSIYTEAWPRLKAAGIPLTIFVATDTIDIPSNSTMTWDQIRSLVRDGVSIAHHGASHAHYIDLSDDEILADIKKANMRFQEELGFIPDIFAYPYGEYDQRIMDLLKSAGFKYAFTQFSSPLSKTGDTLALPRFPLNERYGDIERFKLITGTLPLEIEQVIPQEPVLSANDNPPVYGFTIINPPENLSGLTCYPSHMGQPAALTILSKKRVEVRFNEPFPQGRNKINCTLPAGDGRWFWLGNLFIVQ